MLLVFVTDQCMYLCVTAQRGCGIKTDETLDSFPTHRGKNTRAQVNT